MPANSGIPSDRDMLALAYKQTIASRRSSLSHMADPKDNNDYVAIIEKCAELQDIEARYQMILALPDDFQLQFTFAVEPPTLSNITFDEQPPDVPNQETPDVH